MRARESSISDRESSVSFDREQRAVCGVRERAKMYGHQPGIVAMGSREGEA